jgi:hypothetical protein
MNPIINTKSVYNHSCTWKYEIKTLLEYNLQLVWVL